MASFGTVYTTVAPLPLHPRSRTGLAAAAIGGHEITLPEHFKFPDGSNKTPEFLAKFPLGKIPAFEGADGFLLTESNAIAFYLADTAPKPGKREQLLGATPKQRAQIQQWIWFAQLHVEPATTTLALWRLGPWATYDAEKESRAHSSLCQWLDYMETHLKKGGKWLADCNSEGPTLGDLTVANYIYYGLKAYIDAEMRREYPAIVEWFRRVSGTPEISHLYSDEWVEVRKKPEEA